MKDIKWGTFGNIADNGCGVIATYNVMLSKNSKLDFASIYVALWYNRGPLIGGKLGVNPITIVEFLRCVFWKVYTGGASYWTWYSKAQKSEAIIVLYRHKNSLAMHYVAGIWVQNFNGTRCFRFYNTGYSDIDGRTMSLLSFVNKMRTKGKSMVYFIGVNSRRGRW